MGNRWQGCSAGVVGLIAVTSVSIALAVPSPLRADAFDQALAEIDQALETNPYSASKESLRTCRAMRKTAILLRKMGHHARAARRLKSCRRLLGIERIRPRGALEWGFPCVA